MGSDGIALSWATVYLVMPETFVVFKRVLITNRQSDISINYIRMDDIGTRWRRRSHFAIIASSYLSPPITQFDTQYLPMKQAKQVRNKHIFICISETRSRIDNTGDENQFVIMRKLCRNESTLALETGAGSETDSQESTL